MVLFLTSHGPTDDIMYPPALSFRAAQKLKKKKVATTLNLPGIQSGRKRDQLEAIPRCDQYKPSQAKCVLILRGTSLHGVRNLLIVPMQARPPPDPEQQARIREGSATARCSRIKEEHAAQTVRTAHTPAGCCRRPVRKRSISAALPERNHARRGHFQPTSTRPPFNSDRLGTL